MGNPLDREAPKKYYARIISAGEIGIKELCDDIADISTVSRVDTRAVLEALIMLLPKQLKNSKIVKLGEFGSFSVGGSSEGHGKADEVSAKSIKSAKCNFRPGKEINQAMKTLEYGKKAS
jgi:predicted histone-like DNA-binding protein